MTTNSKPLTDKDIDLMVWRATRGCHFEGNLLPGSEYVEEIVEQDVPRLVSDLRIALAHLDAIAAAYQHQDITPLLIACQAAVDWRSGEDGKA